MGKRPKRVGTNTVLLRKHEDFLCEYYGNLMVVAKSSRDTLKSYSLALYIYIVINHFPAVYQKYFTKFNSNQPAVTYLTGNGYCIVRMAQNPVPWRTQETLVNRCSHPQDWHL